MPARLLPGLGTLPLLSRSRSITSVVAIVLVAITTLFMGVFLIYSYSADRKYEWAMLQKNLDTTADQAAEALVLPMWNLDAAQVGKVLDSIMKDREIYSVMVRWSGGPTPQGDLIYARFRDNRWNSVAANHAFETSPDLLKTERPIVAESKETIGTLELYISPSFAQANLWSVFLRLVLFAILLELALVAMLYACLWLIVLRPLQAIERYARQVNAGDTCSHVTGNFRGELENLRGSIQEMVSLLATRYATLQRQENMLAAVLNSIPQSAFWKDRSSTYLGCNERFARDAGLSGPADAVGKTDFDLPWPAEETENYLAHDREVIASGIEKRNIVEPLQKADGKHRWIDTTKVPLRDPAGNVYALLGVYEDITDRKAAQEAIAAERDFNALLINSTPAFYVSIDRIGNIITMNHTMCHALGYATEEVVGKNYLALCVPPDEHPKLLEYFDVLIQDRQRTISENRVLRKDRSSLLCMWHGTPILKDGETEFFIGMGIDITDRKLAEASLRRQIDFDETAKAVMSDLIAAAEATFDDSLRKGLELIAKFTGTEHAFIALLDPEGASWSFTHEWCAPGIPSLLPMHQNTPLGTRSWTEQQLNTGHVVDIARLENLPSEADSIRQFWTSIGINASLQVPLRGRGGQFRGCLGQFCYKQPAKWTPEVVQRIMRLTDAIAAALDRIAAEHALRDSESRFRSLIEHSPIAISVARNLTRIYVNSAYVQMFGYAGVDRILGQSVLDGVVPELRDEVRERYRLYDLGIPVPALPETIGLRADGSRFPISVQSMRTEFLGGPATVVFITDLTDRKEAEMLMLESEKLRTVAGLAAGVAHEINNPLAAMVQNAQVAINRLTQSTPANTAAAEHHGLPLATIHQYVADRQIPETLEAIRSAGRQASRIIHNLLAYSRRDVNKTAANLPQLVEQTLELAASDYELKKDRVWNSLQIRQDHQPTPLTAECHPSQIQQVLLNLIRNAVQAMRSNADDSPPKLHLSTFARDGYACIAIEDNGPGIPPELQSRMFEPFVTTKPQGEGTGLGLFVSYYIITTNHGGQIRFDPANNHGTRCTISLPISPTKTAPPN